MSNPILDDPQDLEEPNDASGRPRFWLVAGMGIAILLLANNLRDSYNPVGGYLLELGTLRLGLNGLIAIVLYTAGTLWQMESLRRNDPMLSLSLALKNAILSGFLAAITFKSVQLFAGFSSLSTLISIHGYGILIMTLFCGVTAYLWYGIRYRQNIWTGALVLAAFLLLIGFTHVFIVW